MSVLDLPPEIISQLITSTTSARALRCAHRAFAGVMSPVPPEYVFNTVNESVPGFRAVRSMAYPQVELARICTVQFVDGNAETFSDYLSAMRRIAREMLVWVDGGDVMLPHEIIIIPIARPKICGRKDLRIVRKDIQTYTVESVYNYAETLHKLTKRRTSASDIVDAIIVLYKSARDFYARKLKPAGDIVTDERGCSLG